MSLPGPASRVAAFDLTGWATWWQFFVLCRGEDVVKEWLGNDWLFLDLFFPRQFYVLDSSLKKL